MNIRRAVVKHSITSGTGTAARIRHSKNKDLAEIDNPDLTQET